MYRKLFIFAVFSALIVLSAGCGNFFRSKEEIRQRSLSQIIDGIVDGSGKNAVWSIAVKEIDSGEYKYLKDPAKNLVPASNVKLFTTASGMNFLGPEFRFRTIIMADSLPDSNGIIPGNLYIVGGGDPTFSAEFQDGEPANVFSAWNAELREKGIFGISGFLIGVDTLFHKRSLKESSWEWGDLRYYYAAPCGALSYNDNCLNIEINAPLDSGPPLISWNPPLTELVVRQSISISSGISKPEIDADWLFPDSVLVLTGTFPPGGFAEYDIPVENPAKLFMQTLQLTLEYEGFRNEGYLLFDEMDFTGDSVATADTLLVHQSPPLSEIIEVINKESVNLYAEQLLRILGRELYGNGSPKSGLMAVDSLLKSASMNSKGAHFVDGSGLSRHNWVSALVITDLLEYCFKADFSEDYINSLPAYGEGTLKNKHNPAGECRILAKTGSMSGVRARSGYIFFDDKRYVFSILCNNYNCSSAEIEIALDRIIEAVCLNAVSSYKR